jgi:hypothetical protein
MTVQIDIPNDTLDELVKPQWETLAKTLATAYIAWVQGVTYQTAKKTTDQTEASNRWHVIAAITHAIYSTGKVELVKGTVAEGFVKDALVQPITKRKKK